MKCHENPYARMQSPLYALIFYHNTEEGGKSAPGMIDQTKENPISANAPILTKPEATGTA